MCGRFVQRYRTWTFNAQFFWVNYTFFVCLYLYLFLLRCDCGFKCVSFFLVLFVFIRILFSQPVWIFFLFGIICLKKLYNLPARSVWFFYRNTGYISPLIEFLVHYNGAYMYIHWWHMCIIYDLGVRHCNTRWIFHQKSESRCVSRHLATHCSARIVSHSISLCRQSSAVWRAAHYSFLCKE